MWLSSRRIKDSGDSFSLIASLGRVSFVARKVCTMAICFFICESPKSQEKRSICSDGLHIISKSFTTYPMYSTYYNISYLSSQLVLHNDCNICIDINCQYIMYIYHDINQLGSYQSTFNISTLIKICIMPALLLQYIIVVNRHILTNW